MSSLHSNLAQSAIDAARDGSSSSDTATVIAELSNDDNRIAVRTKTARDLMLALAVYRMCTMTWLVNLAPRLISLSEKLRLSAPVYWVVKRTFFHQFCGGETADACISTMQTLHASGIGSILDLSIEADLDDDRPADTDSSAALTRARHNEHADRALALTKQCLDTARIQPGSFAAVKVTALGPPSLLRDLTVLLQSLHDAFHRADTDGHGHLDHLGFRDIVRSLPGTASVPDADALAATLFGRPGAGTIDLLHFSAALSIDNSEARPLLISSAGDGLTPDQVEDYEAMMRRLRDLCDYARECGVRLMIDAEQSYFQRAIDHVAIRMEEEYNRQGVEGGPVVFTTYQMYLKESLSKLKMDVERAQRGGFVLGAKLVRGAYMVSERKRASDLGLPSPILPDLAATHASYDAGVELLLQVLGEARRDDSPLSPVNSPIVFMIASHNRESVIAACSGMEKRGVRPEDGVVMFGQLLGGQMNRKRWKCRMCDQLSYILGCHGYAIYKYLPYGEVREVIPYLIRRAQENSGVLGSVAPERRLLWNELKRRALGSGKVDEENTKTK
ncbi:FAD-linked oxidoreductase-like protein [Endogone sp. FLAS-F59071]|nr:FAD-linked oxidoreductase-like protein [Endogone sp. FLAS-F59071]|eukprot:RUS19028.1 FAD-linked oxidoreductase-like protein [Endogone sp. FLAS-F59071]